MENEIFNALKTKYGKKGFSDKALKGLAKHLAKTITKAEEIEDGITGIEPLLDVFKAENDKRVNEAVKKVKEDAETGSDEDSDETAGTEKKKKAEKDESTNPNKALLEAINKLTEKVDSFERGNVAKTYREKAIAILKEKKIPEEHYTDYLAEKNFKDMDEVDDFVQKRESSWTAIKQKMTNEGLAQQPAPVFGDTMSDNKDASPAVKEFLETKTAEKHKSPLGGKEV